MDLLSITRKIWRYRLLTLPVIVLTICGAAYVVAVKQPVYEAKASFVLLNPPAPPTAEDVARDPSLARVKSDNPYTRFGDQSVIIQILASTMNGDAARHRLADVQAGYTVAPSTEFGYSSPIVQVTAIGWSAETAMRTARIAGEATTFELDRMQARQGVDKPYRIKALQVDRPDHAMLQASGQLRMLVGVLVFGAILLFVAISIAEALGSLRGERVRWAADVEDAWPADGDAADDLWALRREVEEPEPGAVPANGHGPRRAAARERKVP